MIELLWFLLPVAAASGWWAAKRETVGRGRGSAGYLKGLSYLLREKPEEGSDQEIEAFLRMVEVNKDTAETHLALGNLCRRRGEVDRAIRIHRNLIARMSLTAQQRNRALLDLGEDYLRAGLFDRAEALFGKLVERPEYTAVALSHLVGIYEQEKDWRQANVHCDRLEKLTGKSKRVQTAHYCCELAEEAIQGGDPATARKWLRQALDRDPNCTRASILRGRMAMADGRYAAAISAFQAVVHQNRNYFPEVIEPLGRCYQTLERQDEWLEYLREVHEGNHSGRMIVALVNVLKEQNGEDAALSFLEDELKRFPTVLGLRQLIEMKLARTRTSEGLDLDTLYQISQHMFDVAARYKCVNCGFVGKVLYWHCPSCKHWNSIKPIPDLVLRNKTQ